MHLKMYNQRCISTKMVNLLQLAVYNLLHVCLNKEGTQILSHLGNPAYGGAKRTDSDHTSRVLRGV